LIVERQGKPYEILKWKGRTVTVVLMNIQHVMTTLGPVSSKNARVVLDCNRFYVSLSDSGGTLSFPLNRVDISFHDQAGRLKMEVRAS
jgi:hypothetical protein